MSREPTIFNCPKAAARLARLAQARWVLGGVLVHGAFEGDDPGTWDTQTLGLEPEAKGEGDQSRGRMRLGVGGPCSSEDAGERVTPDPVERRGARVGMNLGRET